MHSLEEHRSGHGNLARGTKASIDTTIITSPSIDSPERRPPYGPDLAVVLKLSVPFHKQINKRLCQVYSRCHDMASIGDSTSYLFTTRTAPHILGTYQLPSSPPP